MKKINSILSKFYQNFDYLVCLLLGLIILIPKVPFISVPGIYFNIRIEDFFVAIIYSLWILGVLIKKIRLRKNSLLLPIFIFLITCFVSTLVGIIRKTVPSPLLGVLYFIRYIEYLGMFYVMFTVYRKENFIRYCLGLFTIFILVIIYGVLAKFNLVPMYRTMDTSGIKVYFRNLQFMQSTFGGHYDFGTYVMFNIPILISLFVSLKKWIWKIPVIFIIAVAGYLFYYSYARSAYIGFLVAMFFWFVLKKSFLLILPVIESVRVFQSYFAGKFSKYKYEFSLTKGDDSVTVTSDNLSKLKQATLSALKKKKSTSAAVKIEKKVDLGSDLNISLDPSGESRINRWKELLAKFIKSPILGNGLSSVGIGADGDYVRWLSELGVLGLLAMGFLLIRLFKILWLLFRKVNSKFEKHFFLALLVSFIGLLINAVFIDVFESSKVAFYIWFLTAIANGYYYFNLESPSQKKI